MEFFNLIFFFLIFFRGENDSDDSEDEDEEEEEGSSEEESSEEEAATTSTTAQPELSRQEKRDLKKKQAEDKQKQAEDEDPDLINPNHVQQKMNISDLNTPRELSRRERYVKIIHIYLIFIYLNIFFPLESRRRNEKQRIGIGRLVLSFYLLIFHADIDHLFSIATCSRKDGRGQSRPQPTC
jgi:hypothetical protein